MRKQVRRERNAQHNAGVVCLVLPMEIQQKIWLYLTVADVIGQGAVCYQWRDYISDEPFWKVIHERFLCLFVFDHD